MFFGRGDGSEGMKKGIHPPYMRATITCSCGAVYHVGSTRESMHVEVCARCHPLFTGGPQRYESGGRVERFKKKYGLE